MTRLHSATFQGAFPLVAQLHSVVAKDHRLRFVSALCRGCFRASTHACAYDCGCSIDDLLFHSCALLQVGLSISSHVTAPFSVQQLLTSRSSASLVRVC